MHPVLFEFPEGIPIIGGAAVNSFGFMLFVAYALSAFIIEWDLKRKGRDPKLAWELMFWALIGGVGGAKLYWILTHMPEIAGDPGQAFSATGFTWYGGLIGGIATIWLGAKKGDASTGELFDSIAVAVPLAIPVGRLGCFLAGDDYGMPTGSPLGVAFPNGHPPTTVQVLEGRFGVAVDPALIAEFGQVIPVHPTQLYEVVLSLGVFAVIMKLRDHDHRAGWLFAVWLGFYGLQRFALEFLRVKEDRFLFDTFTTAQVISVLLMGLAVWAATRWLDQPEKARTGGRRK